MGPAGQDVVVVECKAGNDVREASQNGLQTARGHFEYLDSEIIPKFLEKKNLERRFKNFENNFEKC